MELLASDSLRLLYALALTTALFASAVAFAQRWSGGDWIRTGADALLITFLVHYLSVGIPGLLHILSPWSIAFLGILASGLLLWFSRGSERSVGSASADAASNSVDRWTAITCFWLLLSFLIALIHGTLYNPPLSIDALVYHFAAPVDWFQRGHIAIFPLWYGPANSYSPLGGSTFVAWYLAPSGNDVLAKYVQMPPLVLLFLSMILIGRSLGFKDAVSALVALAAVLSRPFISESFLPKDDLYVAAFFITAFAALTPRNAAEKLGPWRAGAALGLMLAMKYTVLFSLPLFLLMIPATRQAQWKWKQWTIALGLIALLAGPWYLRNLILTGNPLYPVEIRFAGVTLLPGLFEMQRSPDVATLAGLKTVFLDRYHSLAIQGLEKHPILRSSLLIALAVAWLAAHIGNFRRLSRDPVMALCIVGPVVGLFLFVLRALYPEIRFIYPSILLLFLCAGIAVHRLIPLEPVRWAVLLTLLVISLATAFAPAALRSLLPTVFITSLIGIALTAAAAFLPPLPILRERAGVRVFPALLIGAFLLICLLALYVHGDAYVRNYHQSTQDSWEREYREADAWTFVRRQLPADATIAIANTNLSYPLQGERHTHRVIHIPTRSDVPDFFHLPPTGKRITGEQMIAVMGEVMQQNPDPQAWLERLAASGAGYLFVAKASTAAGGAGMIDNPAELTLIAGHPRHFRRVFDSPLAVVYQLLDLPSPR